MRSDAGVEHLVNGGGREVGAIEPTQHSLQPAISECLPSCILGFDHAVGIPDDQIAGRKRFLLDFRTDAAAAAQRIPASDEGLELELGALADEVGSRMAARNKADLTRLGIEDRGK